MLAEPISDLAATILRRIDGAPGQGRLELAGPPGSGKTTALAALAVKYAQRGRVVVVCSHPASRDAFREVLARTHTGVPSAVEIGTLEEHMARLLRADHLAAGLSADLRIGDDASCRRTLEIAAAGLFDLSWPLLRQVEFDLDLPFLSRPERFLDEAASLFRLLRRTLTTADQFEESCSRGAAAFYGDGVERALLLSRDPDIAALASKRGRAALNAPAAALSHQRSAETAVCRVLAQLYREYLEAVRCSDVLCPEDVIAEGMRWLSGDNAGVASIAARLSAIVADDGEDAEPALSRLFEIFADSCGFDNVFVAGCDEAAIDGIAGRRSILSASASRRIVLQPRMSGAARPEVRRFADEGQEADWIGGRIAELLRQCPPREVAVLARNEDAAAIYAGLLEARGLPIVGPARRFQDPSEIADWLALGAIVDDPYDHAHLLRVLASPLVGLSDASLWTLCRNPADTMQLSLDIGARESRRGATTEARRTVLGDNVLKGGVDHMLPEETRQNLTGFRAALKGWREAAAGQCASVALALLFDVAGFRARRNDKARHALDRFADDAARVLEAAVAMQAAHPGITLGDIVRALERGDAPFRPARMPRSAVICDAILDAKGQRWQHVIVAGVAHERFPRVYMPRGMAFSRKYGLIVRDNVAGGPAQTAKFAWYYSKFNAKARYLAEEARALRYGLSRASETAVATGFGDTPRWARGGDLLAGMSSC
ncbi:MAG: hypothetical protein GIW99_01030 [Candidatus Eremiobacteraeota bacterium]|nr:hypothetical protein [Candidatus Eremiobacteraeota bacterium]MBC5826270.1 hypothetical protein [Candidatus Eremiobacteraeota bacterium]